MLTVSNLSADPRPGRQVYVSGTVSSQGAGSNAAVVLVQMGYFFAVAFSDPTSGVFSTVINADINQTSLTATAISGFGTSQSQQANVAKPALSGTLTASKTQNGDGSYTVNVSFSGTITVDLAPNAYGTFCSDLQQINGVECRVNCTDGVLSLSWSFNTPSTVNPAGHQLCLLVGDSWGIPHAVGCTVS